MSHIETTFAFRTRILDYLWAGLPMVVTEGDSFAELVEAEGLGVVVPAQDVTALEAAIERVLFDDAFAAGVRQNVKRVREQFYWAHALAPLVSFVRAPRYAADHVDARANRAASTKRRKPYGLGHNLRMFWHYLRADGAARTLQRIIARTQRPTRPR
jgi:hypothetical protein